MIKKISKRRKIVYVIAALLIFSFVIESYIAFYFTPESPIPIPKCQDYDGLQIADFTLVPPNYTGYVKKCSGEDIEKLGEYKNGKHHGVFRNWDWPWIQSEVHFKNGLLDGLSREWDSLEEEPKLEYNFKKGKLHGIAKEWKKCEKGDGVYKFGELYLSQETPYNMGVIEGIDKHYYPEINTVKHDTYKNGKLNGVSRTFWKGKLIIENTYLNNNLHGKCSKWNDNFDKEYVKIYYLGKVTDAQCWDLSGNLIRCPD